jgi:hypothetical protein
MAWYSVDGGAVVDIDPNLWIVDGAYRYLGFVVSTTQFSLTASVTGMSDPDLSYLSYDLTVANRTNTTHSYVFGVSTPIVPIPTQSEVSSFFAASMTDPTGNGINVTPTGPDYDLDGVEMQANFLNGFPGGFPNGFPYDFPNGVNMGVDVGGGGSLLPGRPGQSADIDGVMSGPRPGPLPGVLGEWKELNTVIAFSLTGQRDHVTLNGQVVIEPVPEPEALLLLGLGLVAMSAAHMRRRRG